VTMSAVQSAFTVAAATWYEKGGDLVALVAEALAILLRACYRQARSGISV
jgi:hypothetical protein